MNYGLVAAAMAYSVGEGHGACLARTIGVSSGPKAATPAPSLGEKHRVSYAHDGGAEGMGYRQCSCRFLCGEGVLGLFPTHTPQAC